MSQARLEFTVADAADRGARPYQEDSVQVWRPNGSPKDHRGPVLAVLADGMGGHVAGEKASKIAIARYVENFSSGHGTVSQLLEHSLFASNDGISTEIRKNPALNGMGCTLVAAYIDQDGLRWASVGDSSLLLYERREPHPLLRRLNEDHSIGALLDMQVQANLISAEDAKSDPRRRTLRSALTGSPIPVQEIVSEPVPLHHGDWVILASDGLESLPGDEIARVVGRHREYGEPQDVVRDLLAEVRKKAVPHQDNVTIVAIKVVDPLEAETRILQPSASSKKDDDTAPAGRLPSTEKPAADGVRGDAKEAILSRVNTILKALALGVILIALASIFFAKRPSDNSGEVGKAAPPSTHVRTGAAKDTAPVAEPARSDGSKPATERDLKKNGEQGQVSPHGDAKDPAGPKGNQP